GGTDGDVAQLLERVAAAGGLRDLAQHLVARRDVVQLGPARAHHERLVVRHRTRVDVGAPRQPVGTGRQRADVDVRLAVRVGGGAQGARRLGVGGRGGADDGQDHLDGGRGRVVRVHRAYAHRDRL